MDVNKCYSYCVILRDDLDKVVIKIFVSGSRFMFYNSDVCNSETPVSAFVDLVKTNSVYQLSSVIIFFPLDQKD